MQAGQGVDRVAGPDSGGSWNGVQRDKQEHRRWGAPVLDSFDVSLAYGMPKPSAKRMTWATAASGCSSWT